MVWGGISYEARTVPVVIVRGSLTAARYVEEIFEEHVLPFAPFIGENFLLMHDNARVHVARIVTQYFREYLGIETLRVRQ